MNTEWIECDCSTHVMSVEHWPEEELVALSMWDRRPAVVSWRWRVRAMLDILRGKPYTDDMLLDRDGVNQLLRFLRDAGF